MDAKMGANSCSSTRSEQFVYPIGLPLMLYLIFRAYKIPQKAKRKIVESGLSVTIQMYMDETWEVSFRHLAAVLWSDEKTQIYFCLLSNDKECIIVKDLQGVDSKDRNGILKKFLLAVLTKLEVKGELDLNKFRKVAKDTIEKVVDSSKKFKGPETNLDMLTSA